MEIIMQDFIIFVLGNIFSCFITTFLVFQYLNELYEKRHQNHAVYFLLQITVSACMVCVNLLDNPIINLIGWITCFSIISIKLFDGYEKNALRRVLEITVLFLILAACESLGMVLVKVFVLKIPFISITPLVAHCLEVIFTYLLVLALNYLFISRLWRLGRQIKLTKAQYIVYCMILVYNMFNLLMIAVLLSMLERMTPGQLSLLCVNMFAIVFTNLFLLYFTKFTEENGELKMKLQLLEQQTQMQYEYYVSQEEKHSESIAILHDVGRHLNMLENIYEAEKTEQARAYTKEIREILQPLVPKQYSDHPILNILLDDKITMAALSHIDFRFEIGNVDLSFMESVEITTVFSNLLDNAIEACQQVEKNRFISMRIHTYHDIVAVHIRNSRSGTKNWKGGRPATTKAGNHGIGLINVEKIVKKYNGNIFFEETDLTFDCNIIWNE